MVTTTREIRQPIVTGGSPGTPNGMIPPRPGLASVITADPRKEYVVGGEVWAWYAAYLRSLPWAIDDITLDFGDDLYERIALHHMAAACINLFKASILEDGITLTPALDDPDDPDYDLATALVDECEEVLDSLDPEIDAVLWNMADALSLGNKVAELNWDIDRVASGKQRLMLRSIHPKPRHEVAFVVDAYRKVVALLGHIPGTPWGLQLGEIMGDPAKVGNLLPREKFAIFTWRSKDNDPRGTSLLRPAYDPWYRQQQMKVEHLRYMTQFAVPSLAGFTDPASSNLPATDKDGNVQLDQNGNPIYLTPEQAMANTLSQFRNGSVMAFAGGAKLDVIHNVETLAFEQMYARTDREIVIAITNQELAMLEGQHSSRAQAQVHQDTIGTVIRQGKKGMQRMIRLDILRKYVIYNYGPDRARLTPMPNLGSTAPQDIAAQVTALAAAGFEITPDQYAGIDSTLSLPPRDPDLIAAMIAQAMKAAVSGPAQRAARAKPPANRPAVEPVPAGEQQQPAKEAA